MQSQVSYNQLKKFILLISVFSFHMSYSQEISINDIRKNITLISNKLVYDNIVDSMYETSDLNGKRWVFIENKQFSGLRGSELQASTEFSKQILELIYKSMMYNIDYPISFKSFIEVLKSKGFSGVKFKTNNNSFDIKFTSYDI